MIQGLASIARPARYIGAEVNQVIKDPGEVRVRFALAFPDTYEIGMSHAGIKILYHILNAMHGVWAQRVFAPWPDMAEFLERSDTPLFSLEEKRPVHDFDVLGFSLMYELSYTSVVRMLKLARIPFYAAERGAGHPIVIAGGTSTANPAPFLPFFDLVVIGDGEEVIGEIAKTCLETQDRAERLDALSRLPGVFRPGVMQRPVRRILTDLDRYPFPHALVVPNIAIVHDRFGVEVARGCTRGCRFCQAGFIYRPYRERAFPEVVGTFQRGLVATGYDNIAMLALSITDLSYLGALMQSLFCPSREVAVGVPSMRVEGLTDEVARIIAAVRKPGFTLAPEAATERLRSVINKGNTEEDLFRTARMIKGLGWRGMKLYFMIGLPTERDEDIEAICSLSRALAQEFQGGVTISMSAFNPKPFTPFQWEEQISMERQREILAFLQGRLRARNLSLKWHDPHLSFLEGIFSRGDARLADVIMRAEERGAYLDGWSDTFNLHAWMDAFAQVGLDPESYRQPRPPTAELPWDFIDMRIGKDFLVQERQRAYAALQTPDCRSSACSACGVCGGDVANVIKKEASPSPLFPALEKGRCPYMIGVTKEGLLSLIGQRDWIELLKRAIRRSGLPASYTEGFSPTMRLILIPPIQLGIASQSEYFQVELRHAMPPEKIMAALAAHLPMDARVFSCAPGGLKPVQAYIFKLLRPQRLSIPEDACIRKGSAGLRVWDFLECVDDETMCIRFVDGRTLSPVVIVNAFGSSPIDLQDVVKVATIF